MLIQERTNTHDINFNLVWTTRFRAPVFTDQASRDEMKNILQVIAYKKRLRLEKIKVSFDHVEMLISFSPTFLPSSIVKSLKGTAARRWFKNHPESKQKIGRHWLWSANYFIATYGNISQSVIAQYIKAQGKRPKKRSTSHLSS